MKIEYCSMKKESSSFANLKLSLSCSIFCYFTASPMPSLKVGCG